MILFHNKKVNCQNYPKSIFLNASVKVEASFLQFGYNYSILLIKSGIFDSIGSNRTPRCFDRGQITLSVLSVVAKLCIQVLIFKGLKRLNLSACHAYQVITQTKGNSLFFFVLWEKPEDKYQ